MQDVTVRTQLLYMVTAHLASLNARQRAEADGNAIVGRISDATQGSVSVSTDVGNMANSEVFWYQTQYGMMFWKATIRFRSGGRYKPGRVPYLGVTNSAFSGRWRR